MDLCGRKIMTFRGKKLISKVVSIKRKEKGKK